MTLPSLINTSNLAALVHLAQTSPPGGCFVELGVYQGGSACHLLVLAKQQRRELHLFDTFTGIPEASAGDWHVIGDFSRVNLADVQQALAGAIFHIGVFPATLAGLTLPPIAFAHIDCDQYASTKAAIEQLPMMPGGIMLFDDWHELPGATRAVDEAFPTVKVTAHGKGYVVF
jgi:O-methyltransferase